MAESECQVARGQGRGDAEEVGAWTAWLRTGFVLRSRATGGRQFDV